MVGNFEVPVTPNLRECFSRTHDETSGSLPVDQQFGKDEQYKMYMLCWVLDDDEKIVVAETESNVLELMHYLSDYGLTGQNVLADIRLLGENTVPVAKRLHSDAYRRAKEAEALAIAMILREAAATGAGSPRATGQSSPQAFPTLRLHRIASLRAIAGQNDQGQL